MMTELWQYIFKLLDSPLELLKLAKVNKYFYGIARCNTVWYPLKEALLLKFPVLNPLFQKFENHNTVSDTKRIEPRKKRQRQAWITPKGIWFVYAKHISGTSLTQVLRRKTSRDAILDALCYIVFRERIVVIENRSHPLLGQYRFQRCVQLPNYVYMWMCTKKYSKDILVFTEAGDLDKVLNAADTINKLHRSVFY